MMRSTCGVMMALLISCVLCPLQCFATPDVAATQSANALFVEYWETLLQDNPEAATTLGDKRYSDRWHDSALETASESRFGCHLW